MKTQIIEKANYWINQQDFEEEMIVLTEGIEEHKYCFSLLWCKEKEKHLDWNQRTNWIGVGRLLISKDGKIAEFEGSAPFVDWIHHFELKIQNIEEYWLLEIPYRKKDISKLKSAIKCPTKELMELVNKDDKIIFDESKAWNNHFPKFKEIADDLNRSGINCQVEIRQRTATKPT
ncbi:hypothetical protein [Flavobacterium flavigenum]|uniref:hypothetical protein n=1 Tax=Flavobacterium flavigenum TaxID=3003258 RepID=UPI0022ABE8A5|nr:hypothetical protein [Flavobacterium flavigenum]